MRRFEQITSDLKLKGKEENGLFVYLPELTDWQKNEIKFHDKIHDSEIAAHQLTAVRNRYYHDYFKKWLYALPQDSVILEIGSGSGYDLIPMVQQGRQVIACDISQASLSSIKKNIDQKYPTAKNIVYLAADGENLPLGDNAVEAAFVVASFHHFENQARAFAEMERATKPGGLIILAMEPSRFMMRFTKLFKNFKNLRLLDGRSEADETHGGFSKIDLLKIVGQRSAVIKIKRVWLLLGLLHYGLEATFRIFKLKKRLKVPGWFEWLLLGLDEILLKVPFVNQFNWHWIIIIKNNK